MFNIVSHHGNKVKLLIRMATSTSNLEEWWSPRHERTTNIQEEANGKEYLHTVEGVQVSQTTTKISMEEMN